MRNTKMAIETNMHRSFLVSSRRGLCLLIVIITCWCCCLVGIFSSATCLVQAAAAAVQEDDDEQQEQQLQGAAPESCQHTWTGITECSWEPNLRPMIVPNFYSQQQGETETFYAYVTPNVSSFYNNKTDNNDDLQKVATNKPSFQGFYAKFINMSPEMINIYWRPNKQSMDPSSWSFIACIEPFGATGTVTYIGHHIVATLSLAVDDTSIVTEWSMESNNALYYYDPFQFDLSKARQALSAEHQVPLYHMQWQNKMFAEQYKIFTNGHNWLSLYKQKTAPRFHMWRADYIGQTYSITTNEIHYVELPNKSELQRGTSVYGPRPDERGRARRHRHRDATLDLTLRVLSCSPRVFEISNFLSPTEIQHLLNLAKWEPSTTKHYTYQDTDTNNHIHNAWISRKTDVVTDSIYRRAADVLQINEALLRWRRKTEIPEFKESLISVAEPLQLVHYSANSGQRSEYKPHVDFSIPGLVNMQPSRFATLLIYLNTPTAADADNDESGESGSSGGGETIFPLWLHAEQEATTDGEDDALVIKPVAGKAILFYNLLPDGNYDERSIHASLPVTAHGGEKYVANFWVWDPIIDHTVASHY